MFSAGSGIPNIMRLFSFLVSSLFSFDAILDIALVASFGSFFQKSAEVFAVGLVIFASSCIIFWSFSLFSASYFSSLPLSCIVSASSSVALSSSFEILFFSTRNSPAFTIFVVKMGNFLLFVVFLFRFIKY